MPSSFSLALPPAYRLYEANQALIGYVLRRGFGLVLSDPQRKGEAWTAAALGLWGAARRYDPARSGKFASFAVTSIRGAILNHLEEDRRTRRIPTCDIDAPAKNGLAGDGDNDDALHEMIADPQAEEPGARLAAESNVACLLSVLPVRQQDVMTRLYVRGETVAEVAASMGISGARVHQIHEAALKALRKAHCTELRLLPPRV